MLGDLYYELAREQAEPRQWNDELVNKIDGQRRQQLPLHELGERQQWRDRRLAQLVGHKRAMRDED